MRIWVFTVSACHGAGTDPLSPNCYPSKFFHWWNTVFPHPASELTNGAMRRTNSDYYSFCSSHHIPDVTDLIIIELDTDDNEYVPLVDVLVRLTGPPKLTSPHTDMLRHWNTLKYSFDRSSCVRTTQLC